jgi:hypothetical protein
MDAPLLGHNLMRLVYLDEAGSDNEASFLCVSGVLVHGDHEWPEVDRRIVALIDKYIPEPDRLGFFFHATDIYHGSKYFDRRKPEWSDAKRREELINEIADIINDLSLPVVFGKYRKKTFGVSSGVLIPDGKQKDRLVHDLAVINCLIRADAWLARYAPDELATVIHEDGTPTKRLIKLSVRFARSADHLKAQGYADVLPGLPLNRIIDTVHFAEKRTLGLSNSPIYAHLF